MPFFIDMHDIIDIGIKIFGLVLAVVGLVMGQRRLNMLLKYHAAPDKQFEEPMTELAESKKKKRNSFGKYLTELPILLTRLALVALVVIWLPPFFFPDKWSFYNTVDISVKGLGFLLAGYGLWLGTQRLKEMTDQGKRMEAKTSDDQFHSAVAWLGNSSDAAQISALHSLKRLAERDKNYLRPVFEVMVEYCRDKEIEESDKKEIRKSRHRKLQIAADALFKKSNSGIKSMYERMHEKDKEYKLNLERAVFLRGLNLSAAYFREADMQSADLSDSTNLSGADLCGADLRRADLYGAILKGVIFKDDAQTCSPTKTEEIKLSTEQIRNQELVGKLLETNLGSGVRVISIESHRGDGTWNMNPKNPDVKLWKRKDLESRLEELRNK